MTNSAENPEKPGGRNIPAAIGAGIVLASLISFAVYLGPPAILVALIAISAVAMFELSKGFNEHSGFLNLKVSNPTMYIAMAGMPFLYYGAYQYGPAGLTFFLTVVFLAAFFILVLRKGKGRSVDQMAVFSLIILWVPFLMSFVPLIMRMQQGIVLGIVIAIFTIVNDIGAFVVGRKFGKHKLAKTVSPNKTWEGLFGGLGAAIIVGFFTSVTVLRLMPHLDVMLLALIVALASVVGDLLESLIKRDLKIKDFGTIMPGHGGIMDRIDSHLIAFPVAWIVLVSLGYDI